MRWFLAAAILLCTSGIAEAAPPAVGGSLHAPAFWQAYKGRFITPAGRVVDTANKNISHSEGQGYAMLLAVAADDRATFDLLWQWSRAQLIRDDSLFAWKWDPESTPHVIDANNAADGDLLIAWALAEAGDYWPGASYGAAAIEIAEAISKADVVETAFGPTLTPGRIGFEAQDRPDGPVVNLSYWVFPALWRLQTIAPDGPWSALVKSGTAIAASARFGAQQLPTDWISLKGAPRPADGYPRTFGYDAIRVPLYLAWGGLASKTNLAPYAALWADPAAPPRRLDLIAGQTLEPMPNKGYLAIAALTRCAAGRTKIPPELTGADLDSYYPSTMRGLALIAARQRFPQCL